MLLERRRLLITMAVLCLLPLIPYAWAINFPLISDCYVQIGLAEKYGPISGWDELAQDALYRCRATSLILTYWVKQAFGMEPIAYHLTNLTVHILNVWLVFAMGLWRAIGWRVSALAAAFVAIYEGHQEAVVWHAALPELLVFFFGLLTFLSWILWLQGRGHGWYAAAMAAFLLALLSKESAVAVVGLMVIAVVVNCRGLARKPLLMITPFVLVSVAYASGIFQARDTHLHLNDGTFSFDAPVFTTWLRSFAGMLWFWGWLGLAYLVWLRNRRRMAVVMVALAWMGISLLPYSFLTYMPRVPSRHRYLASVGVALIVSAAFIAVRKRLPSSHRRWAAAAIATVVLVHNAGYLWVVKQRQFLKRAEPTVQLVEKLQRSQAEIIVECFPYGAEIAHWAVLLHTGKRPESIVEDPKESCGRNLTIYVTTARAQAVAP